LTTDAFGAAGATAGCWAANGTRATALSSSKAAPPMIDGLSALPLHDVEQPPEMSDATHRASIATSYTHNTAAASCQHLVQPVIHTGAVLWRI
jgi:hypothetical protein